MHTSVEFDIPAGACDCHAHIHGGSKRFPYAQNRRYTPDGAPAKALIALDLSQEWKRYPIED